MGASHEAASSKARQCEELGKARAVMFTTAMLWCSGSLLTRGSFWTTACQLKQLQDAVSQRSLELAVEVRGHEDAERGIKSQLVADLEDKQNTINTLEARALDHQRRWTQISQRLRALAETASRLQSAQKPCEFSLCFSPDSPAQIVPMAIIL